MELRKIELNIGADEPFCALHSSDGHLCLADSRDGERKVRLAESRGNDFTGGHPERLCQLAEEVFALAREKNELLLYTGDFCDFVSKANLEYAKKLFSSVDAFVCAGNHEYSQYVGEAWEDEAYKAQSFGEVCAAFPNNDIWYAERMIHGVRFVAIDNNYYYVLPEQFERFRNACADGVPVVLMMHNPLYSRDAYEKVMRNKKPTDPPYLCGCPDELLTNLSDHRRRQQTADEVTKEFLAFCNSTPNLRAVLAGHLHEFAETKLDSGIPQIIADGGFRGACIEYTFR